MNNATDYAEEWYKSAEVFSNNKDYKWMSTKIKAYSIVLEIGCGTGQSTCELLKNGHKVIAIEKDKQCLEKAKEVLENEKFVIGSEQSNLEECDVILINCDFLKDDINQYLTKFSVNIIICWNLAVGSDTKDSLYNKYKDSIEGYGLSRIKFQEYTEGNYVEIIISNCCKIAKDMNIPIHIIDRSEVKVTDDDEYYSALKKDFKFKSIEYDNRKTITLSSNGVTLCTDKKMFNDSEINIWLNSILMQ